MSAAQVRLPCVARRVGKTSSWEGPTGYERPMGFCAVDARTAAAKPCTPPAAEPPQLRYLVMSEATAVPQPVALTPTAVWMPANSPWRWTRAAARSAATAAAASAVCGYPPEPFWPPNGDAPPPIPPPAVAWTTSAHDALGQLRDKSPSIYSGTPATDVALGKDTKALRENKQKDKHSSESRKKEPGNTKKTATRGQGPPRSSLSRERKESSVNARDAAHKKHAGSSRNETVAASWNDTREGERVKSTTEEEDESAEEDGAEEREEKKKKAEERKKKAKGGRAPCPLPRVAQRPPSQSMRGRVRYRREDTYVVPVLSSSVLSAVSGSSDGAASCCPSDEALARAADSAGDMAHRNYQAKSRRSSDECLKQRPTTVGPAFGRRDRRRNTANASASDGSLGPKETSVDAATDSVSRKREPKRTTRSQSASGKAGSSSSGSKRSSLVTASSWKLRDGLAWDLWYEQKLKEERERRRREERRRKKQLAQEQERKEDEERKRALEEENRRKWLQRKKMQEEEDRKRLERERKMDERKEQEEVKRNEARLQFCMEYQRKSNEKKEEMRKAEAQQRAQQERLREEAEKRRRELRQRSMELWRQRATRHAKPLTGCIFQRDAHPSAPKAAIDFINPEPWQF